MEFYDLSKMEGEFLYSQILTFSDSKNSSYQNLGCHHNSCERIKLHLLQFLFNLTRFNSVLRCLLVFYLKSMHDGVAIYLISFSNPHCLYSYLLLVHRKLCCATVKSLFLNEGKHGGEATVEAVQMIADLVKTHNCQLHPDSIEV